MQEYNWLSTELQELKLETRAFQVQISEKLDSLNQWFSAIAHGSQPIPHLNQHFRVFQEPLDDDGNPIHLVLTSRDDSGDAPLRVSEAVLLLAAVAERSPKP